MGKIIVNFGIMPLFYQHIIDDDTRLGIWRIEEPKDFFTATVPANPLVSHPYKQLQHLAGRYLLPALQKDFPLSEIAIADTRKPYIPGEKYHFSISHCGNHAAAIVSSRHRVGVDIEYVTPRMQQIRQKFLAAEELAFLQQYEVLTQHYLQLLTVMWSAKEAIYKWYGLGNLDFRRHMRLNGPLVFHSANEWIQIPFAFSKEHQVDLEVVAKIMDPLVLAYVKT